MYEGESATAAAEGFVSRMGVKADAVPQLAAAILRNAAAATDPGKPYLLFAMNVDLDDAVLGQLRFFSDDVGMEPEAAIRFIKEAGLAQREDAQELVDALARSLTQRVAQLGPEAQLATANTEASKAQVQTGNAAAATVKEGDILQASFAVGGTAFDLEFPAGTAANTLASEFCQYNWADLEPALTAELGAENAVDQSQCSGVLAELLLAQLS